MKRKKIYMSVLFLMAVMLFAGCSTTELENRNFPLAIGVDLDSGDTRISYKFQNLSKVADENAKTGQNTDFFTRSSDFYTGLMEYNNDSNKMMDYNHVKVLILGEDYVEDKDALEHMINICQKNNLIAYNTLLFFAEDAGSIMTLEENLDTSIGTYLQEMMEGRKDYTLQDAVTVGDLYKESKNKEQTLLIPVLKEKGGLPVIENYYVLSQFEPRGEISVEEAVLSYLAQGKMKKLSFTMEDGSNIDIQRIKVKSKMVKDRPLTLSIKIRLEAKVINKSGAEENIAKALTDRLEHAAINLKEAPGMDIANSYYQLGRNDRKLYQKYWEDPKGYLKKLHIEFLVSTVFIEET